MAAFRVTITYSTPKYPGWWSTAKYLIEDTNWADAEGKARVKFAAQSIPGAEIYSVDSKRVA